MRSSSRISAELTAEADTAKYKYNSSPVWEGLSNGGEDK
jgi:hypothetical protein